jgi:hypothetical protein
VELLKAYSLDAGRSDERLKSSLHQMHCFRSCALDVVYPNDEILNIYLAKALLEQLSPKKPSHDQTKNLQTAALSKQLFGKTFCAKLPGTFQFCLNLPALPAGLASETSPCLT